MAYLEPNGTIQILENVSLDNSYNNSYWFDSESDQTNFFSERVKKTYPKCYYTRKNRGYIRVKDKADSLYCYNYMRYKNAAHTDKWIYCFILSVDYINENTTQINYEIDLIQTYMFDIVIKDSFIDRQHSLTDEIGDNLIKEDLNIGKDYIIENHSTLYNLTPNRICFIISKQTALGQSPHVPYLSVINGMPSRCSVLVMRIPTSQADAEALSVSIQTWFNNVSDNDLVSIFAYNSILDDRVTNNDLTQYNGGNFFTDIDSIYTSSTKNTLIHAPFTLTNRFGEYRAKNKKLLTYPYKYLTITGADHDSQDYKYELFANKGVYDFTLSAALFPYPEYAVFPNDYLGVLDEEHGTSSYPVGYECGVHITDYPVVPYAIDAYKGYLLQTRGSRTYALSRSLLSIAGGLAGFSQSTIGIGGAGTANDTIMSGNNGSMSTALYRSLFGGNTDKEPYEAPGADVYSFGKKKANPLPLIGSILAQNEDARGLSNNVSGNFNSDGLLIGAERYRFEFFQYCIKPEYAKIIDDYFTMYGYKMSQLMGVISPSSTNSNAKRKRRKYWNFTKTVGCNVETSASTIGCTADEMVDIANIYDKGITFWQPYHVIGDYTGDNSPRA